MKKAWMGILGLAALGGGAAPALAADMAVKAPPPAPLPVMYDWSGFYIGADGGWVQRRNCWDFVTLGGLVAACNDRSGGLIGGQIGYRWQASQFVFGLEAQGDWTDLKTTRTTFFDPTLSIRTKTDGLGLFTGQIGWAAWNAALLYIKGGAAVTGNSLTIFDTATGVGLAGTNTTRWGGTVGVGFEYGIAPNWSVGAEYDHLFMGNTSSTYTATDPRLLGTLNDHVKQDLDMVTLRVNYRFGGFVAPMTGRY